MPTLNWIGKDKVINHHMDVPFKVLEHSYGFDNGTQSERETNSGNKIIHGDNLEALKALLPEYEGRINCIYIDPPYNTGNENWIYNDNVNDSKIKKWLGNVVGRDDLSRHDKWLSMMYPRLKLLHKLLAENGVLLISINFQFEHSHLKCIVDEIFGKTNYVGEITWESTTQPINSGSARFGLQQKVEPIIFYAKNIKTQKGFVLKELDNGLKYPHNGKLGKCRFEIIEKSDAGGYKRNSMKFPILGQEPRVGKRWQIGEDTAIQLEKNNRIEIVDGIVKKAIYPEDEIDKQTFIPFWSHFYAYEVGTAQSGKDLLNEILEYAVGFDTVKPLKLLEEIISHFDDKAIILDSFSGSGTTAHAVLNLNNRLGGDRKFILIEMEKYAENITSERIKRVIKGYNFSGEKKFDLKTYKINLNNLKNAESIIEDYKKFKVNKKYSSVKIEARNDNIIISGTEKIASKVEGIKGGFDFFTLGQPLFLEDGNLNEEVTIDKIRQYIFYSETKKTLVITKNKDNKYFLGKNDDTGYYFNYELYKVTTLDHAFLATIKTEAEQYVIYADNCLLTKDFMTKNHIIFKKIPRDITRF